MCFLILWGMSGKSINRYHTRYHAEQFMRALHLNGTPARLIEVD